MAKYNLDNYFDKDGLGFPLNFRRGNPNPLDNSSVWKSFVDAQNYAQNDPTAYVGQILSVVDNEHAIVDVYKINDTAGNLVLVGTVTLGDDQSIVKNDDDTLSLYDFGKKYYKFVAAEGDVIAHYEVTEGWKDGLEPKVSGGVLAWYEPNPTTVDGVQSFITMLQAEVDTAEIAIKDNSDAIKALETLVGTDSVTEQISGAIENLKIFDYAKAEDLNAAIEDICANTDTIEILQGLVGERTVDERINAAVKETVDGVEQDKFALRVHGHTISDVDGLDAVLDTKAANDIVNAIDLRVQAIEDGLDINIDSSAINAAIDVAIQEHNNAADLKYETITNVAQLSSNIDAKVDELQRIDADNLIAAKTHTETKITELNITQYAKQSDLEVVQATIDTIKDHATVDSFTDVMDEIDKKQDVIPENTYDSYGASAAVDTKLEIYKIEANDRLAALESVDNVTHDEMDAAVNTLEAADDAILAKIGTIANGDTVANLIGTIQAVADNAQSVAETVQGDVDTLEAIIGTVPAGSDTVIAYVNKKAQEVLDAATGGSSESAISVKLALDNYKSENDPRVAANATAAANAQSKADDAYELADTKTTIAEVNAAIEGAVYDVTEEVNTVIDSINDRIGEVPAYSTVMEEIEKIQAAAIYDDTDVRSLIDDNAQAIAQEKTERESAVSDIMTELEGKINTKVEQADYDTTVGELAAEDVRLISLIDDNAEAINGMSTQIYTLVDTDTGKSVRAIVNEELAAQLIPENASESLGTLQEIAAWIQAHPDDASAMNAAIEALYAKVDTEDQTVSAYVAAAIDALSIDDYATVVALSDAINAEIDRANGAYAGKDYEATVDGHVFDTDVHVTTEDRHKWNGAQSAAEDTAAAALATARTEITVEISTAKNEAIYDAEGKIATAKADVEGQIVTAKAEAIANAENKVNTAKSELQGNIDTVSDNLDDYKTENDATVALKANSADVYTKDEIEYMLTWGSF